MKEVTEDYRFQRHENERLREKAGFGSAAKSQVLSAEGKGKHCPHHNMKNLRDLTNTNS